MAAARDLAVVQFDRYAEAASTDFVGMDNADGMQQCLSLLRHEGCRTFVYVGAQPQTTTASERLASFLSATTAEERPTGDQFLGDFTMSWGVAAATRLLAGDRLPDAVVCGADVIAVGLMGALRSAGVQIPEQLRLVSFDDSELGRVTVPALASVHQPIDSMATEAVRLLDMRREHRDAPIRKSLFQPELITRGSAVLTA
jgi:LacI family transcriptional regulator